MSLRGRLCTRIAQTGPISLAEYMAECLLHPTEGYYTNRAPFGADGDFTTAPEISQMFGELLGLCLAQSWMDQGATAPVTLAELGPGRGTLMADALRATRAVPGFHEAAEIILIEASDSLRQQQSDTLAGFEVTHCTTVEELPEQPLLLLANEFFDALPIRQFTRGPRHWRETHISLASGSLVRGLGPDLPQPALEARRAETEPGDVIEYAPGAAPIIDAIGRRIETYGGAALIIDYGDWRSLGDTFQAVQGHQAVDPLANPGQADLTAHVDFEALAAACPCAHSRLTPQGVFLERLGITHRAQTLAAGLRGSALEAHIAAHRRLTHPDEMGNLFKVMGLFPTDGTPPPGLEA
ncbi:class I SAM-dependent methyltransferase [Roseobacter sinensis]|uniref:SAM-dependent methyltransferase n=1 Tax=Roseobacter sinensis TaxID=2931391 RepID=A0ABT3BAH5_9RHOB|nr:SAM-dependent methyltransferase [Roseobacter sp. WL0113]MCV3270583.1 SAM-dependent methyltransferase [Roseobacter sp. WL0113]